MSFPSEISCPTCGSGPGFGCTYHPGGGGGLSVDGYHAARHRTARLNEQQYWVTHVYGMLYSAISNDPLDVTYGGVLLRHLIKMDEDRQRENIVGAIISPAQRAAISAYWSEQLRAKVEAKRKDDAAAAVSVYVEQDETA